MPPLSFRPRDPLLWFKLQRFFWQASSDFTSSLNAYGRSSESTNDCTILPLICIYIYIYKQMSADQNISRSKDCFLDRQYVLNIVELFLKGASKFQHFPQMSLKVPTFFSETQCDFPEPQPQNVWRWLLGKLRERPVFSHRICAFKCLVVQLPARHDAMESWWVPELGPENPWHVFGLKHVSHFGQGSLGACFFFIYVFWKNPHTNYKALQIQH